MNLFPKHKYYLLATDSCFAFLFCSSIFDSTLRLTTTFFPFLLTNTFTKISAPIGPYGTNLATMIGGNPNGNWTLFVQDDALLNVGVISNGWLVTLTLGNPIGQAEVAEKGPDRPEPRFR